MSQSTNRFKVENKTLILEAGMSVTFDYRIVDTAAFDDAIVVRLNSPSDKHFNENVFGVGYDGKILWQIEEKGHVYDESPYTYIGRKGNKAELFNFDGLELVVEPSTGKILHQQWGK